MLNSKESVTKFYLANSLPSTTWKIMKLIKWITYANII
jgi:hypothetical protein